jgi:amidase
MADTNQSWEEIAAATRASLLASIPPDWLIPKDLSPSEDVLDVTDIRKTSGLLTGKEIDITDAGAVEIVTRISEGVWRAEEVTLAFCKAAAVAHQVVGWNQSAFYGDMLFANKAIDKLSYGDFVSGRSRCR